MLTKYRIAATGIALLLCSIPLSAQLDPLLFLKRIEPNVIFAVDLRAGMLLDADGAYYDPFEYAYKNSGGDAVWQMALGVTGGNYRRKYLNFAYTSATTTNGFTYNYQAASISTLMSSSSTYSSFYAKTKYDVMRTGLAQVVAENSKYARFGLIKMRQSSPSWGSQVSSHSNGNLNVLNSGAGAAQQTDTETNKAGMWYVERTTVNANNGSITAVQTPAVKPDSSSANSDVASILGFGVGSTGSGQLSPLIPASNTSDVQTDAPVEYMLDDAKAEATRLINGNNTTPADTLCRNTVVILVVAGGEGTTASGKTAATLQSKALDFKNIGGRRVPIYVIAIAPPSADRTELQGVATNSGGEYFEITKDNIDAAAAAGTAVPELVYAVTKAIQKSFQRYSEYNTAPSNALPTGPESEYQVTSPIVGTVNLENANDISGATLVNTNVVNREGNTIPQRSNVMVTAGFVLPGFDGRLRAFRVYHPEADSRQTSGYKFVSDGTRLWVGCAPGTTTSGACSTLTTSERNLFTVLPDGTMLPFTAANAAVLAPYLSGALAAPAGFDASALITFVRSQPLGAIVSSTPAIMDPPSLDPPPDSDYVTFASDNKDRRSIVWVGANDGILHGIDARLGIEVWGFIPFNLLPKLRTLRDGEPVPSFTYLADGSPKIADVKVNSAWKTYLVVGQGAGGTFYQAFDVTLPGIASAAPPTENTITGTLTYFSDASHVPFKWSYPRYVAFDQTKTTATKQYGDLGSLATTAEKTVGQTWSDPAIGQVQDGTGPYVVITGSGFFAYSAQQALRGGTIAGTMLYMLNVADGTILDSVDVGSDGVAETVDDCTTVSVSGQNHPGNCQILKNALQADPVATGATDSRFINKAYIGDLDGRVWRVAIGRDSNNATKFTSSPLLLYNASLSGGHGSPKKTGGAQPLFSSMATVTVGGSQQYVFFGTGSDLLSSAGVTQSYQLIGFLDNGSTGVEQFSYPLTQVTDGTTNEEKVSAFPAVAGDIVFFSTTLFRPQSPCLLPDANLYAFTYLGGAAYDSTGDDTVSNKDTPKVKTVAGTRATAPFVVDQHLVFGTGSNVAIFGDPEDYNNGVGQAGVRVLSWREVR